MIDERKTIHLTPCVLNQADKITCLNNLHGRTAGFYFLEEMSNTHKNTSSLSTLKAVVIFVVTAEVASTMPQFKEIIPSLKQSFSQLARFPPIQWHTTATFTAFR